MVGVGPRHRKPPGTPQRSRATAACLRGPHRGPRSLLWRMARSAHRERGSTDSLASLASRESGSRAPPRRHHGATTASSLVHSFARPLARPSTRCCRIAMLRSLAIHAARIHHSRCIVTATVSSSRVWRGLSASSQWSSEQVGIERAFTIPGDWYTGRKHYEREIDAIFAPTRPASSSCDPYSSPATVAPLASVTRAAPSSTASWLPVGFSHQVRRSRARSHLPTRECRIG